MIRKARRNGSECAPRMRLAKASHQSPDGIPFIRARSYEMKCISQPSLSFSLYSPSISFCVYSCDNTKPHPNARDAPSSISAPRYRPERQTSFAQPHQSSTEVSPTRSGRAAYILSLTQIKMYPFLPRFARCCLIASCLAHTHSAIRTFYLKIAAEFITMVCALALARRRNAHKEILCYTAQPR